MHRKGPDLVTETSSPDYQRITNNLFGKGSDRASTRSGRGSPPHRNSCSTTGYQRRQCGGPWTCSRSEGVLTGQPGKAVYVRALPDEAAVGAHDLQTLSKQVAGLIEAQGRLEGNLVELYDKTGHDYPYEDLPPGAEEEGDRREQHA